MEKKELKLEVTLNPKTIGILRRIKGVTASQLANRMFISHSTLKKAECNQVAISPVMNVRLWKGLVGIGYTVEAIYVINEFVEYFGGVTSGTN
ncbi:MULTISPECIES: transcriptional regulator [Bacillus cereus group]|uniref:Transcriptional regulator n=1 Tax=Bacillus cereus TaxID=1396 RepID=A0A2B3TP18_BACCE|nr:MULTISPECIES: transcriptional regulator [Bacillus cereus group]PFU37043.1 transcriptional regulator [Bacillus cereus]PHB58153.1 transcriptional regulator [Bacillus wiedmannii]